MPRMKDLMGELEEQLEERLEEKPAPRQVRQIERKPIDKWNLLGKTLIGGGIALVAMTACGIGILAYNLVIKPLGHVVAPMVSFYENTPVPATPTYVPTYNPFSTPVPWNATIYMESYEQKEVFANLPSNGTYELSYDIGNERYWPSLEMRLVGECARGMGVIDNYLGGYTYTFAGRPSAPIRFNSNEGGLCDIRFNTESFGFSGQTLTIDVHLSDGNWNVR
jgi:hypothetical protein